MYSRALLKMEKTNRPYLRNDGSTLCAGGRWGRGLPRKGSFSCSGIFICTYLYPSPLMCAFVRRWRDLTEHGSFSGPSPDVSPAEGWWKIEVVFAMRIILLLRFLSFSLLKFDSPLLLSAACWLTREGGFTSRRLLFRSLSLSLCVSFAHIWSFVLKNPAPGPLPLPGWNPVSAPVLYLSI